LFFAFSIKGQSLEKTIKLQMPEEGQSRYTYIPFEVSENTNSLSFSFEYDKKDGANRLEFGIFDPRFSGRNDDKNGFRGWSGSVRDSAFIAEDRATNGYSAGKIPAGTWYFIIGLAQIDREGVELKLRVEFNQIDAKPLREFVDETTKEFKFDEVKKLKTVRTKELKWFRGDLHAHSFHGDGRWSVRAILESAKTNDLDFVALTEHNTFTHHQEIDDEASNYPAMLILRGEEVTTYGGHINVWGLPTGEWVDFRVMPSLQKSATQIATEAEKFGALASINHPTMQCGGCNWTYDKDWSNLNLVEVWNATWDSDDEKAFKIWNGLLQQGRKITAIGSSDSHQPPYEPSTYPTNLRIGNPTVFIGATALDQKSLLEAIKKGRVFVTEKPEYSIKFTADKTFYSGDKIEISKNQRVKLEIKLEGFPAQSRLFVIIDGIPTNAYEIGRKKFSEKIGYYPNRTGYARIEVRDREGKMLGFTNPIYFQLKNESGSR
jgi:hypothetical protein